MSKNKDPLEEIRNYIVNVDEKLIIDQGEYPFCENGYFSEELFVTTVVEHLKEQQIEDPFFESTERYSGQKDHDIKYRWCISEGNEITDEEISNLQRDKVVERYFGTKFDHTIDPEFESIKKEVMDFYDNARYEVQRRILTRALESWSKQVRKMFAENIIYSRVSRWALDYANEKNVKPYRIAKEAIDYLKELMTYIDNELVNAKAALLKYELEKTKEELAKKKESLRKANKQVRSLRKSNKNMANHIFSNLKENPDLIKTWEID